jgi:hypothetical protein
VPPALAFNTAASFTTNTNWQNYVPETTMSYLTQMVALAYHNWVSAAAGMALAIAFIRGITRREQKTIGNFWVDMVRGTLWILAPLCLIGALVLVSQGVVQNLKPYDTVQVLDPYQTPQLGSDGKPVTGPDGKPVMQTVSQQVIAQGPTASQEIIKELGTNGGGFFKREQRASVRESHSIHELPRDVLHFSDSFRLYLHVGQNDRLAATWMGSMGSDGCPVLGRSDYGILGGGARQSLGNGCGTAWFAASSCGFTSCGQS